MLKRILILLFAIIIHGCGDIKQESKTTPATTPAQLENITYSLKCSPEKIQDVSKAEDVGTWNTANVSIMLYTSKQLVSGNLLVFLSDTTNVKVTDSNGNNITAGTVKTDDNGIATLTVQYYTKEKLEYNASIQVIYGNASLSIPVTITAETQTPVTINLAVYPSTFTYLIPSTDTGTWRSQFFYITLTDSAGNLLPDEDLTIILSSQHTKLFDGDIEKPSPMTIKTTSNGSYLLRMDFYTYADANTKLTYSGQLVIVHKNNISTAGFQVL